MEEKYVEKRYFNPSRTGAFDGLHGFMKANPQFRDKKNIDKILSSFPTYTKHKPLKRKFKRRRVVIAERDILHSADLIDYQKYASENKSFRWILLVVDLFSKFIFTEKLKRKNMESVSEGFRSIYEKNKKRIPQMLWLDQGLEFYNRPTLALMKKLGINMYSTKSKMKAAGAEANLKQLRYKLAKYFTHTGRHEWISVLQDFTKNINTSYHRAIKMSPTEASLPKNSSKVWCNLYTSLLKTELIPPKYSVGERVRISKNKAITFTKGFDVNYSSEHFIIDKILFTPGATTYKLKDEKGEDVETSFYEQDLVRSSAP
jgi:hypothetical protein